MDVRRADLHTHTIYSDGKLTPAGLVKKAHESGLRALAVTDHDTIDALDEAERVARGLGMEFIPGVELSVTVTGSEIHMLGYYFDASNDALNEHLTTFRALRTERAITILERLADIGIGLTMEEVLACAEGAVVGRPHVAQALVNAGLAASYQEAFDRYLKDHGPCFVPKPPFPARDGIEMLHEAGGVAVLAHPGTRVDGYVIKKLIQLGLDGIETVHPSHSPALSRRFEDLARKFGLIETGGSDYHGFRPEEDRNFSRYSIPYGHLEMIRRAAA